MEYQYTSFTSNRTTKIAETIFEQRINDSKYIFNKHSSNFIKRNCPYCNSPNYSQIDLFHGMYGIDKCSKCSSLFINPTPDSNAISDYYENCLCNRQLSEVISKRYNKNDYINDERVTFIINILKEIQKNKPKGETIRILEVGCNNGAFLSKLNQGILNKISGDFELSGVDIDSEAIKHPLDSSLNLFHGVAEDIYTEHKNKFDLIIHFELIEHLINPSSFVKSINKMLTSQGKMVFTTPNILGLDNQALDYNNMRYLAHALFPPMHLNAFSTQNLAHFLLNHNFSIDHLTTPGKLDLDIISLLNHKLEDDLFIELGNLKEKDKGLIQHLLIRLNASSHMQCVASKI